MKSSLLTFVFISAFCSFTLAQRNIDAGAGIRFSYGSNFMMGPSTVQEGNYSAPSLFNNFSKAANYGLTGTMKIKKYVSVKLHLMSSDFSEWSDNGNPGRFSGATFSSFTIHPGIGVNSPFKDHGLLNALSFSAFVGPSINFNKLKLDRAVFEANVLADFMNSSFTTIGVYFSADADLTISKGFTLGFSYGLHNSWVSSPLFDDKTLLYSQADITLGWRFLMNKRYKYSSLW